MLSGAKSAREPQNEKAAQPGGFSCHAFPRIGAGEGIRTLDPNLGKVVLYH